MILVVNRCKPCLCSRLYRLNLFMTQLHAPLEISDEPTRRCVKGNGELLSPRLNDLKNTKKIPLHNRLSQ